MAQPPAFAFLSKVLTEYLAHNVLSDTQSLEVCLESGYAETEVELGSGRCLVAGNPLCAVVLMALGDRGPLTLAQLSDAVLAKDSPRSPETDWELAFHVGQLVEQQLLAREGSAFALNADFFDRDRGMVLLRNFEGQEAQAVDDVEPKAERNFEYESKIVRRVKARQHSVEELRAELEAVVRHFDISVFRSSLQCLLQNETVVAAGVNKDLIKFN